MVNAKRSTQVICHKNGRPKVFYKITNHVENHNEFQYKEGLNILQQEYNSTQECGPGGLYVTNKEDLHEFAGFGHNIREIHIPKDAKITKFSQKYKVDKLIFLKKYSFSEFIKKHKLNRKDSCKLYMNYLLLNNSDYDHTKIDIISQNKYFLETYIVSIYSHSKEMFLTLLKQNAYNIKFLKKWITSTKSKYCYVLIDVINQYLKDGTLLY
jgi:hypothetical protein